MWKVSKIYKCGRLLYKMRKDQLLRLLNMETQAKPRPSDLTKIAKKRKGS